MNISQLRIIEPFFAPAAILIAATLVVLSLPADLIVASEFFPFGILPVGVILSLWFNRGRAFLALTSLFFAYIGYGVAAKAHSDPFAVDAVVSAIAIFIPLNVALMLALPERGVFHFRSYRWLLLLTVEILLAAWISSSGQSPLSGVAWRAVIDHWLLHPDPTPFVGRLLFAAGIALAIGRIFERRSPQEIGLGSALLAFFAACTWIDLPGAFAIFFAAAGIILLVAILQESHRLAFHDELTGLPGRRMLEEQLAGLGPAFTIAMVDVDHFKQFNDTHGHDVGDQVLRMVGASLADIKGGGRAYRYGGEEFAILFPDKALKESVPHLDQLRITIQNYALIPRTQDRRQAARDREDRRTKSGDKLRRSTTRHAEALEARALSVTVSIGVAERNRRLRTPAAVIRAADEALYRAKHAGRNRISR